MGHEQGSGKKEATGDFLIVTRLVPHQSALEGWIDGILDGPTFRSSPASRIRLPLRSLELPRGEAADMDVELVEAWVVAVTSELDLELQLVALDGKPTDGTGCADARPAPCTVRRSGRELPRLDAFSGLPAEDLLIGHGRLRTQQRAVCVEGVTAQMPWGLTPACVNQ